MFLGGVGFLRTLGVGCFYRTVQLNYFLHRRVLTRASGNGAISFEIFVETENSYCAPRFPLSATTLAALS